MQCLFSELMSNPSMCAVTCAAGSPCSDATRAEASSHQSSIQALITDAQRREGQPHPRPHDMPSACVCRTDGPIHASFARSITIHGSFVHVYVSLALDRVLTAATSCSPSATPVSSGRIGVPTDDDEASP